MRDVKYNGVALGANGEECEVRPVKHDGVCGIMGIKDAAEKEAIEKVEKTDA
jgi:hypothetical protein